MYIATSAGCSLGTSNSLVNGHPQCAVRYDSDFKQYGKRNFCGDNVFLQTFLLKRVVVAPAMR
jgi:hypothetical protein